MTCQNYQKSKHKSVIVARENAQKKNYISKAGGSGLWSFTSQTNSLIRSLGPWFVITLVQKIPFLQRRLLSVEKVGVAGLFSIGFSMWRKQKESLSECDK